MCAARNEPAETIEANIAAAENRGTAEASTASRPWTGPRVPPGGKFFVVDSIFLGAASVRPYERQREDPL